MIYRKLLKIYILLLIKICIIYSKEIDIKVIIYSFYDTPESYYRLITNGFNEYSKENGLGINVELTVLTPEISSAVIESYGDTIDSLLERKSTKYDIYFYYSAYSKKYADNFINLRDYIPKEIYKGIDERLLEETCSSKDKKKLVGLPVYLYLTTLFSNQPLLNKYHKEIPKTWDELMSTSKYIYDEEKKLNNTIIRYNGVFNDYTGSMSVFEFINSFRESNSSPHPELRSKTTIEALEKLKEMKDEIGEDIFKASDDLTMNNLFITGEALFLRYFYNPHVSVYRGSALPGKKKGVSGSIVIPTNLGISNNISEERKKAAAEFLKYVALKETQKKYIIRYSMISADMELYDDEEVCSIMECDIIKDSYPFSFMDNDIKLFGDDSYHISYRENMFDYLYNDRPVSEVVKIIDDITRIYTFTLNTDDSNAGLIIYVAYLILLAITVLSLIFVFIKRLKNKFKFLSKDMWILTTLGTVILMSSILTLYGDVTNAKCHLRISLVNVGFILSICPSIHILIKNFPESNKISSWFEKNKYLSILTIMLFTLSLNGLFAIPSYHLQDLKTSDGLNYQKCNMNNLFGSFIYYIIQIYGFFIILISLALIFVEWNLAETHLDIKYLSTAFFMDILSLLLFNILGKMQFKNYMVYNVLLAVSILLYAVSNHLFIYFIRLLPMFGNNAAYEAARRMLGKMSSSSVNDQKIYSSATFSNGSSIRCEIYSSPTGTLNSHDSRFVGITKKIISYHNQKNLTNVPLN